MLVLAALHIIVSQQYRMEVARVNAFRGAAGLGCSVAVDMQRKQAPFAHHRGQVGEETPDSKTAPEGAAVYLNIRANLLRLYAAF